VGETNIVGSVIDGGHNISSDASANFTSPTSRNNTDPLLGALGYYGGSTPTMPLLPTSPAIDTGDNAACPPTDQRGVIRPQGLICDIGAFELAPPPAPFQNLGFDEAKTNNIPLTNGPDGPMGTGLVAELLPGWRLFQGTNEVSTVDLNVLRNTSGFYRSLYGSQSIYAYGLDGLYGLALSEPTNSLGAVVQRGDVPGDAYVLTLKYGGFPFVVQVNGAAIPPIYGPLPTAGNFRYATFRLGAAYGGHNVELRFTQDSSPNTDPSRTQIISLLDSIEIRRAGPTDVWFQRTSPGVASRLYGALGTENGLVAVGANIANSADGSRWVPSASPTTNPLSGVTFGNGLWVAVGERGTILTSSDASTWVVRNTDTNGTFYAVTYAQGLFVAVGGQRSVFYGTQARVWTSPDGMIWTDRSPIPGAGIYFGVQRTVIYVADVQGFVSAGDSTVLVSPDGLSWRALPSRSAPIANSMAYGAGKYLTVGPGISISTNAIDWTQVNSSVLSYYYPNSVVYYNSAFWVAGYEFNTHAGAILRSTDANYWLVQDGVIAPTLYGISAGKDCLLAVGEGGGILQSGPLSAPAQFRYWEMGTTPDGSLVLPVDAPPGGLLSLEGSADLRSWTLIQAVTNYTTRVNFQGTNTSGARFYRARID
jgi:hypothetical protein